MPSDTYILGKANFLAQQLYVELGFPDSDNYEFYNAEDGFKKQCWDMAVIAYRELIGIDPNLSIPKPVDKVISISDLRGRIHRASKDGKRTVKKRG